MSISPRSLDRRMRSWRHPLVHARSPSVLLWLAIQAFMCTTAATASVEAPSNETVSIIPDVLTLTVPEDWEEAPELGLDLFEIEDLQTELVGAWAAGQRCIVLLHSASIMAYVGPEFVLDVFPGQIEKDFGLPDGSVTARTFPLPGFNEDAVWQEASSGSLDLWGEGRTTNAVWASVVLPIVVEEARGQNRLVGMVSRCRGNSAASNLVLQKAFQSLTLNQDVASIEDPAVISYLQRKHSTQEDESRHSEPMAHQRASRSSTIDESREPRPPAEQTPRKTPKGEAPFMATFLDDGSLALDYDPESYTVEWEVVYGAWQLSQGQTRVDYCQWLHDIKKGILVPDLRLRLKGRQGVVATRDLNLKSRGTRVRSICR